MVYKTCLWEITHALLPSNRWNRKMISLSSHEFNCWKNNPYFIPQKLYLFCNSFHILDILNKRRGGGILIILKNLEFISWMCRKEVLEIQKENTWNKKYILHYWIAFVEYLSEASVGHPHLRLIKRDRVGRWMCWITCFSLLEIFFFIATLS